MTDLHKTTEVHDRAAVPRPLSGVRILDLTHALAGPFATMILGDLGAEVLKVERPAGDLTRTTPPLYVNGMSLFFLANNRNKKGLVLDLKQAGGREIFYDLTRVSDVVVYNFSPGVARRLGIEHERLAEINPDIITCDITGFGSTGPEASRPALDLIVQAAAGALSITGEPGRPPAACGVATGDLSTGLHACIGILAALRYRSTAGRGIKVETSLFHSQLTLLNYEASFTAFTGESPGPQGSEHLGNAASQAFETSDGWIVIDAGFDHHFVSLCAAIGRPEVGRDPRYRSRLGRVRHRDELRTLIAAAIRTGTTEAWFRDLGMRNIPCGPVNNVAEALTDPQAMEYRAVRPVPFEETEIETLATPLWFDESIDQPLCGPPELGEHTMEVLRSVLGYDEPRIRAAIEEGAVLAHGPNGDRQSSPRWKGGDENL